MSTIHAGDFVIAPWAVSDGTCRHCRNGMTTSCENGLAWGRPDGDGLMVDGGQGEYVRVPLADGTLAFREGAPTEKLPGGKFFMEKYNAQKYDNPPEAYGAFAYAAMDMILDSIEKVGPDRKKVIADLANVKDRDSIVGKITFDDHGQNTVPVITKYVVQDGKFVEWDDSEYASGKRKLPGQK